MNEYIEDFKTKIGDGIVVGIEKQQSEGTLTELDGTNTHALYHINYKAIGIDSNGNECSFGATHVISVFNEGTPEEKAVPTKQSFKNPIDNTTGSTLQAINDIFHNSGLRNRVRGAILKAANAIRWEDVATEQHAARVSLSGEVIKNPDPYINAFMFVLANDTTETTGVQAVGVNVTDTVIENLVNGAWNYIAETQGLTA